ncbi:MAG: ROK family protein [Stellaceae bacterium]
MVNQNGQTPSRRVFGLGIDEKVQWVVADVTSAVAAASDRFESDTFDIDIAGPSPTPRDLEAEIRRHLEQLKGKRPALFRDIQGLGVSTIGVVNQIPRRLRSIARKNWIRGKDAGKLSFLIDFSNLFRGLFSADVVSLLEVQNDVTAKALVEYHLSNVVYSTTSEVERLLFLSFGEGVNGGIISKSAPLSSLLHPEMGHITPRPHPLDLHFIDGGKSCPAHEFCFEAVASGARIRQSWGGPNYPIDFNISDLPDEHVAWQIIPQYIAQLCMIGTLILAPKRLVVGGCVISGREGDKDSLRRNLRRLLPRIRHEFAHLNNNYLFYDEMRSGDFIQTARVPGGCNPPVRAALRGGGGLGW